MGYEYKNMDYFFESIFGYKPKKRGAGYEMLVGAVFKILNEGLEVKHDVCVKGQYSRTSYQIDDYIEEKINDMRIFVEVKDYTERDKKTGRGDIQKLAGALIDLNIDTGILASATGFTRPTKQYSQSTKENPAAKPIDLFHIRPSNEKDTEGCITSVYIECNYEKIDKQNSKHNVVLNESGLKETSRKLMDRGVQEGRYSISCYEFYDINRNPVIRVSDILNTSTINEAIDGVSKGEWLPQIALYADFMGELVLLEKIEYEIPFKVMTQTMKIEVKAVIKVKSEDGQIDRIIFEEQLRNIVFCDDGTIYYRGAF